MAEREGRERTTDDKGRGGITKRGFFLVLWEDGTPLPSSPRAGLLRLILLGHLHSGTDPISKRAQTEVVVGETIGERQRRFREGIATIDNPYWRASMSMKCR